MEINFSNEVKAVLENSRKEAIRHNNSIITPEHLFLALLADTGSRVFALLERVSRGASVYQLMTPFMMLQPRLAAKSWPAT